MLACSLPTGICLLGVSFSFNLELFLLFVLLPDWWENVGRETGKLEFLDIGFFVAWSLCCRT